MPLPPNKPGANQDLASISVRWLLRSLDPFLKDPAVTEICVNRPKQVYTEKNGQWAFYDIPDMTLNAAMELAIAAARYSSRDFSETAPILSAVLPDGERAQFVCPPACQEGTVAVTIRKPSHRIRTLSDYIADGFFDKIVENSGLPESDRELLAIKRQSENQHLPPEEKTRLRAAFLEKAVLSGKNIVIAGATGSGKTTFMKALTQAIPLSQRIITIEDVPELFLPNHDNHVHLFYPSEAKEGDTVTAASLLRSCLRMKPDRILLAELRGGETFDFLNACLSGHAGSITSCHAGSCRGAFDALALKVKQSAAGGDMDYQAIRQLLYLTIDIVIHVQASPHGRHISEIWFTPETKETGATC